MPSPASASHSAQLVAWRQLWDRLLAKPPAARTNEADGRGATRKSDSPTAGQRTDAEAPVGADSTPSGVEQ